MRSVVSGLILLCVVACGERRPDPREVAVDVGYVALDERVGAPVIVLEERSGDRSLPIWIGSSEARSIAAEIEHRKPPRPNTHDLARKLIQDLDARIERVVVTELRDRIYYAVMVLQTPEGRVEIDSRPSDAIAIGLRAEAPLFAAESLLEREPAESETLEQEDDGQSVFHPLPRSFPDSARSPTLAAGIQPATRSDEPAHFVGNPSTSGDS